MATGDRTTNSSPVIVISSLPEENKPAPLIGTHNGTFHCDEALACALLRRVPKFASATVLRTRDPKLLDACDVVVDVGAEFDAGRHRYDHHQRGFEETFHSLRPEMEFKMKLSSAGLVYVHFGEEILTAITGLAADSAELKMLFRKLYEDFLLEIDAVDNGVLPSEGDVRYKISTGLSARVGHLNTWWNGDSSDEEVNRRFIKAMELTESEFLDRLDFFRRCWWPARSVVADSLSRCDEVHASGRLLVFKDGGVPWKSHLLELEVERDIAGRILFVLYPDPAGNWRVQAVPADLNKAFENRLSLPEPWRGVRDEALAKKANIEGAIFVHASGFIGGVRSYEGALQMATKAMESS